MWAILQAAGWPIYFILVASILTLAIIIERTVLLSRGRVLPNALLALTVQEYKKDGVTPSMLSRLQASSALGRVLAAGLKNISSSRDIMRDSIEETGRVVTYELERFLPVLNTVVTAAPLLGLFGTVIGLIEMFGAQTSASGGALNGTAVAHGIAVALYNTAAGILVALVALVAHRIFRNRVDHYILEMEQQALKLLDILHSEPSTRVAG